MQGKRRGLTVREHRQAPDHHQNGALKMASENVVQTSLRYRQCEWGDLVEGSKEQLQALGIGLGASFPGEPGAPKREVKTYDARGFSVKISHRYCEDGVFCAFIRFPDWPEQPDMSEAVHHVHPGIQTRKGTWFDEHLGTAEDLVSAGLIRLDLLPGAAGMRKTRVSVRADGSAVLGPPTANCKDSRKPGASLIERASKSTFRVRVILAEDEKARRLAAEIAARRQWEQTVRALPRPARLDMLKACHRPIRPVQRGHLRLVWSAP